MEPIDGKEFMRTCTHRSKTAAGLDDWEPGELALLSLATFEWIAVLLNMIEAGMPWPEGMQHARAAYLVENPSRTDDHRAYRVLLILPALNKSLGHPPAPQSAAVDRQVGLA